MLVTKKKAIRPGWRLRRAQELVRLAESRETRPPGDAESACMYGGEAGKDPVLCAQGRCNRMCGR